MKRLLLLTGLVVAFVFAGFLPGVQAESAKRAKNFSAVKSLLTTSDPFMVIEYINGLGTPEEAALAYTELVKDFYWKEKSLPMVKMLGQAGIQYCLIQGQVSAKSDKAKSDRILSYAKTIAYDLASFTWPGWQEKGITLSTDDLKLGLNAAKLNLRLAKSLKKPAIKMAYSYWIMGAQLLAHKQNQDAIDFFNFALDQAEKANDKLFSTVCEGYVGLARIVSGIKAPLGLELYEQSLLMLESDHSKDSQFFFAQLKSVKAFFANYSK